MRVLFVHKNFPGQFLHLAPAMAAAGHDVRALGVNSHPAPAGVQVYRHTPPPVAPVGNPPRLHPWAANVERDIARGEATAAAAAEVKKLGFTPDLICAHTGWGEALFLKDVWPEARLLGWFEMYIKPYGGYLTFDPEFIAGADPRLAMLARTKNGALEMNFSSSDHGISATQFQKDSFPAIYRPLLSVCHEGIDTDAICPDPTAQVNLPGGVSLSRADEVITFCARDLEPVRGYHVFMRALPEILAKRPKAHVIVVGNDGVSYGLNPPAGTTWAKHFLQEVADRVDLKRLHIVGSQPREVLTKILQVSSVHVYMTYPFVLSWSCLEAMACGAVLVGSRTGPVEEVITHGQNGLLVDFFDREQLVETVCTVFEHPDRMRPLGMAARRTIVDRYDAKRVCVPRQLEIATAVAEGRNPSKPIAGFGVSFSMQPQSSYRVTFGQ